MFIVEGQEYYTKHNDVNENIYDIWERGEGQGDSITPSTYNHEYRSWMSDLLLSFQGSSREKMHVLSLGCGNAAVEALLIGAGHVVDALDINEEAISYARKKGVNAQVCDLFLWNPQVEKYDLVYCDGIFGHLLDEQEGFQPILKKIKNSLKQGGVVVISNDSSQISEDLQPHPAVPGFFWFTDKYLVSQLESSEFKSIKTSHYFYKRPISGERNRLVATAHKG